MRKFLLGVLALLAGALVLGGVAQVDAQSYGYPGQDIIVISNGQTTWCTASNTIIQNSSGVQWLPASACPFSIASAQQVVGGGGQVWIGGQPWVQPVQPVVVTQPIVVNPCASTFGYNNNFGFNNAWNGLGNWGNSWNNGCGCQFNCGPSFNNNGCFQFNCGGCSFGCFNACVFPGSCGQGRPPFCQFSCRPDRDRPDEPEPMPHPTGPSGPHH